MIAYEKFSFASQQLSKMERKIIKLNPNRGTNTSVAHRRSETKPYKIVGTNNQMGTDIFGQPSIATTTNTGIYGNTSGFGGTYLKFEPVSGTDEVVINGQPQNINTQHHCITFMKIYGNKSLEELRYEDYLANRKSTINTSLFGSNTSTVGNTFGQPSTSGTMFGQPAQDKTIFGQTNSAFVSSRGIFSKPQTTAFETEPTTNNRFVFGSPVTNRNSTFFETIKSFDSTANPVFSIPTQGNMYRPVQPSTFTNFGNVQPTESIFGSKFQENIGSSMPHMSITPSHKNPQFSLLGEKPVVPAFSAMPPVLGDIVPPIFNTKPTEEVTTRFVIHNIDSPSIQIEIQKSQRTSGFLGSTGSSQTSEDISRNLTPLLKRTTINPTNQTQRLITSYFKKSVKKKLPFLKKETECVPTTDNSSTKQECESTFAKFFELIKCPNRQDVINLSERSMVKENMSDYKTIKPCSSEHICLSRDEAKEFVRCTQRIMNILMTAIEKDDAELNRSASLSKSVGMSEGCIAEDPNIKKISNIRENEKERFVCLTKSEEIRLNSSTKENSKTENDKKDLREENQSIHMTKPVGIILELPIEKTEIKENSEINDEKEICEENQSVCLSESAEIILDSSTEDKESNDSEFEVVKTHAYIKCFPSQTPREMADLDASEDQNDVCEKNKTI